MFSQVLVRGDYMFIVGMQTMPIHPILVCSEDGTDAVILVDQVMVFVQLTGAVIMCSPSV